jgi:transcriptional regulator of acetoin/glycerol metabolism
LARGEWLRASDFAASAARAVSPLIPTKPLPALPLSLDAYERAALQRALAECNGDASGAARRLGIGRSTFYRRLARLGIAVPRRSAPSAPALPASASHES